MSSPLGLDPDLLRAFVFIAEDGSFTRAAARVGRTQSAVSMQVQRLEAMLGHRLLSRGKGGAVQLTPHGQFLLTRARELLALNDQIWSSFHTPTVQGTVRLGTPDDYALRYLPTILRRFAESHPSVQVDVLCLPSSLLVERLRAGELDLTLCSDGHLPPGWPVTELWRGPLAWVTSESHVAHRQDPLPLALAADQATWSNANRRIAGSEHCAWSAAACRALDAASRCYRIAYYASTLLGTHVPVLAGLAVTVGSVAWLPDGLRAIKPEEGFPPLPEFSINMLIGAEARQPVTDALAEYISATFRADSRGLLAA